MTDNEISKLSDPEDFPLTVDSLKLNKRYLVLQREIGNASYQYKGNCTKAYAEKIADKNIDREWEWVKNNPMPDVNEHPAKDSVYKNEIRRLVHEQHSWKTRSPLIKRFHPSALDARREGHRSPSDGWKLIQESKADFRKFYLNRLRCSDWFNEHRKNEPYDAHFQYLVDGKVPPFIYAIGLTTSGKYMNVSMFKPHAARMLVNKYLSEFDEVFDPFSGFSGRLLGVVALGKKYIGRDLSGRVISESMTLMEYTMPVFIENGIVPKYDLGVADASSNTGAYQCLLTCSPYGATESWDGVPDSPNTCDDWIDVCLKNYSCMRYVFVVDGNISKYRNFVKETFTNMCHWGKNDEFVVVIEKADRDKLFKENAL